MKIRIFNGVPFEENEGVQFTTTFPAKTAVKHPESSQLQLLSLQLANKMPL